MAHQKLQIELLMFFTILHRVSKNVQRLTCCSVNIHNPIMVIFGRRVTEKVRNQTMLCLPTSPL